MGLSLAPWQYLRKFTLRDTDTLSIFGILNEDEDDDDDDDRWARKENSSSCVP